ncbi:hypothetical protein [Streptomyces sp. CS147]|uniref:hypothetical protein n=1 Tax=Streptomyces TaxID=1883 RepID=UPI001EF5FC93|nr:hypothetical protein [Streptomyces sp. CS147]
MAATTDSVFQPGSIAKVYTATLIMRLAESRAVRGALPRAVGRAGRGGEPGAVRPARRAAGARPRTPRRYVPARGRGHHRDQRGRYRARSVRIRRRHEGLLRASGDRSGAGVRHGLRRYGGGGAAFSEDYMPVVFSRLEDGTGCVHIGMRCGPKAA